MCVCVCVCFVFCCCFFFVVVFFLCVCFFCFVLFCFFCFFAFFFFFFLLLLFFFSHVYSPRQGQTTHWVQKFYDNRKAFSLCPSASFKMISSKSDFIHIFNDFIHIYSPGQGQKTPWGQTFGVSRKPRPFTTMIICCKFQTNLFEFGFYTHLLMFFHMYITPGQGQTTLCGQNSDVNKKALSLCPFVASFKKNLFEV